MSPRTIAIPIALIAIFSMLQVAQAGNNMDNIKATNDYNQSVPPPPPPPPPPKRTQGAAPVTTPTHSNKK
jgi:hypothetical protein